MRRYREMVDFEVLEESMVVVQNWSEMLRKNIRDSVEPARPYGPAKEK